mmetsp:Transcript_12281/g.29779  ORF Transcript_12281/g.29779 Transcript_12281/m.29779 type:complete len:781 (+) Transcript_12281:315-2657(+)|eukprot:CAMPEP_0178991562 /NCGR_PEP_ID=MMETSP0795-20121207/5602_1 /TAXON_ID=88552 /ORGANISM="Amoebophrya sp., Strain Ameob2" /LENGTH=780 /DNA_ID=CAMNT_0020683295 /DNA_START=230 /DNA_END=2572 /DNA_ORIENTATION=+
MTLKWPLQQPPVRKANDKSQRGRHDFSAALEQKLLREVQAAQAEAAKEDEEKQRQDNLAEAELHHQETELMKRCMETLRLGNNGQIVGREKELAFISSFIANSVAQTTRSSSASSSSASRTGAAGRDEREGAAGALNSLYISGVPGVGKTLATSHVLYRRTEESKLLNCMTAVDNPTPTSVLKAIMNALPALKAPPAKRSKGGGGGSGAGVKALLEKIEQRVRSLEEPFVLVLDEVDFFCKKKNSDVFSKLFTLPQHGPLTLIGIANSIGLLDQQKCVYNDLNGVRDLVFRPYGGEEMKKIVLSRLDQVTKKGIFGPQTLEFLADRASKFNNGDCRKALELSARALDEMKQRKLQQDHASTFSSGQKNSASSVVLSPALSTSTATSAGVSSSSSSSSSATAATAATSSSSSFSSVARPNAEASSSTPAAARTPSPASSPRGRADKNSMRHSTPVGPMRSLNDLIGLDIAQEVVVKSMSPMEQISPIVKSLPQMQQLVLMCFCVLVSGVNDQGVLLEHENPDYVAASSSSTVENYEKMNPGASASARTAAPVSKRGRKNSKERAGANSSAGRKNSKAQASQDALDAECKTDRRNKKLLATIEDAFATPNPRGAGAKTKMTKQGEGTPPTQQDQEEPQTADRLRDALIATGQAVGKVFNPFAAKAKGVPNGSGNEKTVTEKAVKRCLSTEEVLRILQEICKRGKDNVKVQANILNLRSVENYLSMLDETPLLRQVTTNKGGGKQVRRELAYASSDVLKPILQKNPSYQEIFLNKKLGIARIS